MTAGGQRKALADALRAFLRVWLFATLGLFLPGLLGWINEVTRWARDNGTTPFPDAHGLAFLVVAAISGAFPAAIAGLVRWAENTWGFTILPRAAGPGTTPQPPPAERGAADSGVVLALLGVGLLFVYAFLLPHVLVMVLAVVAIVAGLILLVTNRARL